MTEQQLTLTEQQEHLKGLIEKQKEIIHEIESLNNQVLIKKEILLKIQGAIEYLQQIGVSLWK